MFARSRNGAALIETLIALVILATAGVGLVTLLGQTVHTVRQFRGREREFAAAGQALDATVAWSRTELDARIGNGRLRTWQLGVSDIGSGLYELSLSDTLTGAELLRTTLYRPITDTAVVNAAH